eukprot:scaffold343913_cov36-Prasinocladus_malaysianus.AAC.1
MIRHPTRCTLKQADGLCLRTAAAGRRPSKVETSGSLVGTTSTVLVPRMLAVRSRDRETARRTLAVLVTILLPVTLRVLVLSQGCAYITERMVGAHDDLCRDWCDNHGAHCKVHPAGSNQTRSKIA